MPDARERFAVVIPVGPSDGDVTRGRIAIASLAAWEPLVPLCVIVEDRAQPTDLIESAPLPASCRKVVLRNPRRGTGYGRTGGLCAGILTALAWIHEHASVDFVLKLDTDALVIAPFSCHIAVLLSEAPNTGIIGTLGISCNPNYRPLQDPRREPDLLRLRRFLPRVAFRDGAATTIRIDHLGLISVRLLHSFETIRPYVDRAVANGYASSRYCQGGAYAISREMLTRMAALGCLGNPDTWTWLPVGEDMAMAMYAHAVGLELMDASSPGQPFAIQASSLPYPPGELLRLRYSIVHSIRNDPVYSEATIVDFFQNCRSGTTTHELHATEVEHG